MGEPVTVNIDGADNATLVTVPEPPLLTVAQEVLVPSVVKYLPEFVAWDGNNELIAAVDVVCPVPPLAISTVPDNVCTAFHAVAPVALNELSAGVEWLTVKVMPRSAADTEREGKFQ
jgi:hypothetical protein